MTISIRIKLLVMCILLVLLTTVGLSATYYSQIQRYMQNESRERLHIALDIALTDLTDRNAALTRSIQAFLATNAPLSTTLTAYAQDPSRIGSIAFITSNLSKAAEELYRFAHTNSVQRLTLYGFDRELLAVYQGGGEYEELAIHVPLEDERKVYIPVQHDVNLTSMLLERESIPPMPNLALIQTHYDGDVPATISTTMFTRGTLPGVSLIAPIYQDTALIGVVVLEDLYAQEMLEQYASLSKTELNFFIYEQLGVGTLTSYTAHIQPDTIPPLACEDMPGSADEFEIGVVTIDGQRYYQGQCRFDGIRGILAANLSLEVEEREISQVFRNILIVAGLTILLASIIPWFFSRSKITAIYNILHVIVAASEGDLRPTALSTTNDEIGMLGSNVQKMIVHLRTLSGKAQDATQAVNGTADTILQKLDRLGQHMEQQSASVENTTTSVENIDHFIDDVAQNSSILLVAAAQILSSIQETRASIQGVTTSTDALTTNLHLISSAVDEVNGSVKHISDRTEELVEAAQHTETEIQHIDQSLRDVSQNAGRSQQLAKETMEAAIGGQTSVEASLQGMEELKEVVTHTAQIIEQINGWGEQVSSILGIVDDITEQTSLLALNASIISAQAGDRGRGFAVVADEIKELAMRTKTSTKEIDTLIHQLQASTKQGVKQTAEGLSKAEDGLSLVHAVQDALNVILERATLASNMATDTAGVIQHSASSSQSIRSSMNQVTDKVSSIRTALQHQEQDVEQVAAAVESISGMAEQVSQATLQQTKATEEIERSMEDVTEKFNTMSDQTSALKEDSHQVVMAMRIIESTTGTILRDVAGISADTVKNLLTESDALQQIVNVFKIS